MCDSPRTGDVHEEQQYIYVAQTSNNRVIMACELYCCLLPQCEALHTRELIKASKGAESFALLIKKLGTFIFGILWGCVMSQGGGPNDILETCNKN